MVQSYLLLNWQCNKDGATGMVQAQGKNRKGWKGTAG